MDVTETQTAAVVTTATLSISLPNTETPQRLALGASTKLTLADRVKVVESSGGISTVSSVGTEQTELGVSSNTGNVWTKPSIFLRSNAVVGGFIKVGGTVTQQTGVSIVGPVTPTPITASTSLTSWTVAFPGGSDIFVPPSQVRTLAPGGYGNLNMGPGAQIKLSKGTYYFGALTLEVNAKLIIDDSNGPVFMYVQNVVLYKGSIVHVGGGPGDFLMGCSGCADVSLQGPFSGTLVAPTANLTLTSVTGGHVGAFFAKRITVNPDVTVRHQTFRNWDSFKAPSCPSTSSPPTAPGPFKFCGSGNVGPLPPAIPPDESKRIRDKFRWPQTTPVPNFNANGDPTLFYARIYVEDRTDLEVLDQLLIHWDHMPLFDVERDIWAGMTGATTSTFDGEGGFVFAVIPGVTYNLIREAALCTNPALATQVFRAVVLWDIPVAAAKNANGSLNYDYLGTEGFRYRGLPNCPDDQMSPAEPGSEGACDSPFLNPPTGGDPVLNALRNATSGSGLTLACEPDTGGTSALQQPWGFSIGKLVKRVVRKVVAVSKGVVDLGRKGLAFASRLFKGSTTLTVNLEVRNSDPGFGGMNTVMLRAWGARRGQPVPLAGVQVRALQQISFRLHLPSIPPVRIPGTTINTPRIIVPPVSGTIPFDSLSTGTANALGTATIKVVKSSTTGICVPMSNRAAEIQDWLSVREVCSFRNPVVSAADLSGPRTITVPLAGDVANDMAQLTESHSYVRDVMGHTPKQVIALTGFFADTISSGGRAYAPCLGYTYTSALVGAIGARMGQFGATWVGNKVESYLRDAAKVASEQLDAWAAAADRWAAARIQAAGTSAAQAVAAAEAAVIAARDAALTARQAAGVAAEGAASLSEAAKKVTRLLAQGAPAAAIAQAEQELRDAVNTLNSLNALSQQAAQSAATAAAQAQTAVAAAFTAAANTTAAGAAAAAAESARLAASIAPLLATLIGNGTTAILQIVGGTVGAILGAVIGQIADIVLADVDIVLPSGDSTVSRGVASHEYGHFAFCDIGYRTDPGRFAAAWVMAAADTVATQAFKLDQSQFEHVYFNEGIADFFSGQTAGGVSYFPPAGSFTPNFPAPAVPAWVDPMSWCGGNGNPAPNDQALRCLEDNFGARTTGPVTQPNIQGTTVAKQVTPPFVDNAGNPLPFVDQVARVASILHDAFDGRPNAPAANVPGNGAAWIVNRLLPAPQQFTAPTSPFTTSLGFFRTVGSLNDTAEPPAGVIHEENIMVPGSGFPRVIAEWLRREPPVASMLRQETFLRGLTQVMQDNGGAANEVCRLYSLHQGNDTCPSHATSGLTASPPPPLFVCPPNTTLTNGQCINSVPDPG